MTQSAQQTWDPTRDPSGIAPHQGGDNRPQQGVHPRHEFDETREHLGGQIVRIRKGVGGGRAALRREADVLSHVQHPAFPTVYSLNDATDHTELIVSDAGSRMLSVLAATDQPLEESGITSAEQLSVYLQQAGQALRDLHGMGWLHGDVCLENIALPEHSTIRWVHLENATSFSKTRDNHLVEQEWSEFETLIHENASALWFAKKREQRRWQRALPLLTTQSLGDDSTATRRGRQHHERLRRPVIKRPLKVVATAVITVIVALSIGHFGLNSESRSLTATGEHSSLSPVEDSIQTPLGPIRGATPSTTLSEALDPKALGAIEHNGVQYQLGTEHDEVVVGRWSCDRLNDQEPTAIAIRHVTGEVFWFPTWAGEGEAVESVLVAEFDPQFDVVIHSSDNCDVMVVNNNPLAVVLPR